MYFGEQARCVVALVPLVSFGERVGGHSEQELVPEREREREREPPSETPLQRNGCESGRIALFL